MKWKFTREGGYMKKTLITKNNVRDYISDGKLIVTDDLIISPGVFDILRNQDIKVVYADSICEEDMEQEEKSNDIECLIEDILKEEYKMLDSRVINNVSKSVIDIINNK